MRRTSAAVAIVVGFALLVVVPLFVVLTFDSTQLPEQLELSSEPSSAMVVVSEEQAAGSATLTTQWGSLDLIRAPIWSGVVTEVGLRPGDTISEGSFVAGVDGVRRIAVRSPAPWYRMLGSGAVGADVGDLQDALIRLGFLSSARDITVGTWGPATSDAVQLLAEDLGVAEGASRGAFDPGWFVWIDPDLAQSPVEAIDLIAGQPAPSTGAVLARTAPQLLDATASSVSLVFTGEKVWDVVLADASTLTGLQFDGPEVTADALAVLGETLEPPADPSQPVEFSAQMTAQEVVRVARVPPAAWIRTAEGDGCVWVREDGAEPWKAVPFTGFDSQLGIGATQDPQFLDELNGHEVLLNANDVLEDSSCPSSN